MKCPSCDTALTMSERSGIEIDYCSQCRGVWLDRGELDKIIERSAAEFAPPPKQQSDDDNDRFAGKKEYFDKDRRYDNDKDYRHKKKSSFLGEMFDF